MTPSEIRRLEHARQVEANRASGARVVRGGEVAVTLAARLEAWREAATARLAAEVAERERWNEYAAAFLVANGRPVDHEAEYHEWEKAQ